MLKNSKIPAWKNPEVLNDQSKVEYFEYTTIFNHQVDRPAYQLRAYDSHPSWARHPERLPPALLLGELLFNSPDVLGPRARFFGLSCASCHPNGAASLDINVGPQTRIPGGIDLLSDYFTPMADDGIFNPRNVPSLRGARYTAPYGHAGSIASLGEFIDHVAGVELGQPPMRSDWREALVLYLEQLDFLPDPQVDALGRLTAKASESAHRGEKLFAQPRAGLDGLSCASCHIPESLFTDRRTHLFRHGKYDASPNEAFDTPSLLGMDETPPYFYDGSAPTLAKAVDAIDTRQALALTDDEKADLTAYLRAIGAVDRPAAPPRLDAQVNQALAYLRLVLRGSTRGDRGLWPLCLDTVSHQLRGVLRAQPSAIASRLEPSIRAFAKAVRVPAHRAPSAANRAVIRKLRGDIQAALKAVRATPAPPPAPPR